MKKLIAFLKSFFMSTPKTEDYKWNTVKASSFADPKDIKNFEICKATGKTDQQCFKVGDNGIGAWGHVTCQTHTPMVALPREIWKDANKKGGALLKLRYKDMEIDAILGDTMPSIKNIKNGAGIDLNPAVALKFNLKPPFMIKDIQWRWA